MYLYRHRERNFIFFICTMLQYQIAIYDENNGMCYFLISRNSFYSSENPIAVVTNNILFFLENSAKETYRI